MRYHWSEILFVAGFVTYTVIRGRFIKRSKSVTTEKQRVNRSERILLPLVFVGNMLVPIAYLLTPLLAFADYQLPAFAPWCGVVLMPVSLWLFWRSHVDLGDYWSVTLEIRKGHRIVQDGVYRFIRHPMYAAILLFGLAQGMMLWNWLAGWSALASFVALYLVRTPREEKMMLEVFGDDYASYSRRTGRIFPKRTLRK